MCLHFQIAPIRTYAQRTELANSKYTCPRDIKDRRVIDFLRTSLISEHHIVSAYFFNIPGKTAPPHALPPAVPGHIANTLHAVVFEKAATIWQH